MEKHIIKVGFFGEMNFFHSSTKFAFLKYVLSPKVSDISSYTNVNRKLRLQYFFNLRFVVKVDRLISLVPQQKFIPFDSVETSFLICFCFSSMVFLNSLDFSFASLIEIK